jgi:hypothetical protein
MLIIAGMVIVEEHGTSMCDELANAAKDIVETVKQPNTIDAQFILMEFRLLRIE